MWICSLIRCFSLCSSKWWLGGLKYSKEDECCAEYNDTQPIPSASFLSTLCVTGYLFPADPRFADEWRGIVAIHAKFERRKVTKEQIIWRRKMCVCVYSGDKLTALWSERNRTTSNRKQHVLKIERGKCTSHVSPPFSQVLFLDLLKWVERRLYFSAKHDNVHQSFYASVGDQ